METKEEKKQNTFKKILIGIIVVLVIFLAIAIPFSILNLNNSEQEKSLTKAKDVKDYECTKKGEVCSFEEMYEGVEVNVEVAKDEIYTFIMIANDRDTMTLMLQQNIEEDVAWHSELINMKGPQLALQTLNEKVAGWTKISFIENYNYTDGGKKDLDKICNSDTAEPGFKCPEDESDSRCYNGLSITNGTVTFYFNLPKDANTEDGVSISTEGTILAKAKARLITLEEIEEYNTDDGIASWLIEGLAENEGYWTMTSSPSMTTAYYQGAISLVNKDGNPSVEATYVAGGQEANLKVGLRPVITIDKK